VTDETRRDLDGRTADDLIDADPPDDCDVHVLGTAWCASCNIRFLTRVGAWWHRLRLHRAAR
jgi:hypothetical protein